MGFALRDSNQNLGGKFTNSSRPGRPCTLPLLTLFGTPEHIFDWEPEGIRVAAYRGAVWKGGKKEKELVFN